MTREAKVSFLGKIVLARILAHIFAKICGLNNRPKQFWRSAGLQRSRFSLAIDASQAELRGGSGPA